jgi:hypothetical protein
MDSTGRAKTPQRCVLQAAICYGAEKCPCPEVRTPPSRDIGRGLHSRWKTWIIRCGSGLRHLALDKEQAQLLAFAAALYLLGLPFSQPKEYSRGFSVQY